MADAESIRQLARSRAPFSAWLGIVLLFILFGVIVLALIGPMPRGDTYEQKRAKAREEKLKTAREEDAKALGSYAWIDKNKGLARIPIARAIALVVGFVRYRPFNSRVSKIRLAVGHAPERAKSFRQCAEKRKRGWNPWR